MGVEYIAKGKKQWRAYITVDGEKRRLGTFMTEIEAAQARDEAAIAAWGGYAVLNFNPQAWSHDA